MENHLVKFENLQWIDACEGMRYKKYEKNYKVLRLIELTRSYCDLEWCTHGHIGIIIEGDFKVEFQDHIEEFKEGDIVFIPGGEEHKHKASVNHTEKMKMLSFEI